MKFKTLEKIDEDFLQNRGHHVLCPTAIKLLKQEAINRIKHCHDGCTKNFRCRACERDRWFNNLKEEDLK